MKIGLQIPHFRPSTPATLRPWLKEAAQAAEAGGFDSLWLMDHFLQLGRYLGPPESEMLEGYSALGYLAGVTERIHLGLLVGGVIYRQPAIAVKSISTLDVLSGGRTYFGLGAAWYDQECAWLGLPFPPVAVRFEMLEEALQIAHQMFSGDDRPFAGRHYQLARPWNNPQPLHAPGRPHPPILIGGMGEKKTLRLVARYADACNFFGSAPEAVLQSRLETLQRHCEREARDYAAIEKTVLYGEINAQPGAAEAIIEKARTFARLGFSHVIFNLSSDYTPANIDALARNVLPALRAM